MARKKKSPVIDLDEVFIEPSLLERLFPTFVKRKKGEGGEAAKKSKKPRRKRKKSSASTVTLSYPIVNMLPKRFMMEVRRKRIARVALALYGVVLLGAGGVFFSNYTDITIANNKLSSAEQRLNSMTMNYSDSAPLLSFVRELRSNATLVNSLNSAQVDYAQVVSALTAASPAGVSITNLAVASGGSEEVQCVTDVSDPFGSGSNQAPDTGCVVFSGTSVSIAGTADLSRSLESNPLFATVSVTPGGADDENVITFEGVAGLSSSAMVSTGTLVDVSGLPQIGQPAGESADSAEAGEGVEDVPVEDGGAL